MIISPFGGKSKLLERIHTSELTRRYKLKCNADISFAFGKVEFAELYECQLTGYKFWFPWEIAGNDEFYKILSASWVNYYQEYRWEYQHAANILGKNERCLEIGCGRGNFLKMIESTSNKAVGLELNSRAISTKVCKSKVLQTELSDYSKNAEKVDKVFAFQLLEHLVQPKEFLEDCLQVLKPGGILVISAPNDDYVVHKNMIDVFNMPPHHMGCYNYSIVNKISKLLEMEIMCVLFQPPELPDIAATQNTKNHKIWRLFTELVRLSGRLLLSHLHEPGHTMFVVIKKPIN